MRQVPEACQTGTTDSPMKGRQLGVVGQQIIEPQSERDDAVDERLAQRAGIIEHLPE